ncbi:MAG: O-antigen ligase family protein [Pirellulales bacterium]|nr:O-antigen ligase family protein [Pirellulales bacterium]
MIEDDSGRDAFGRFTTIIETTDPLLLMLGIGIVVLLVVLGFMRKYEALFAALLVSAAMSGVQSETLDSALTVVRWIVIGILAANVVFVRQHPGIPIVMLIGFVVMGLVWSIFSESLSWAIQSGVLFLATTLVAVTSANLMADRVGMRRFFWLYLIPTLVWTGTALVFLPDFLAGRMQFGFGRFQGFAGSSAGFSTTGSLLLPCLLWQAMQSGRVYWRLLSIGMFVFVMALLLLSTQRTAIYGGVIACIPLLFSANIRALAVVLVVALGTWLLMTQLWGAMNKKQSEFIADRMTDTTTTGRYDLWMYSINELMRDPMIGRGFGSDRWLAQGAHLSHKQRPHNWYIVTWHNTGFGGLLWLLATIGVAVLGAFRLTISRADVEIKSMARLIMGQILGICATGMTESLGSPSNIQTLTFAFFLVAAGRLAIIDRQEQADAEFADEYEYDGAYGPSLAHPM